MKNAKKLSQNENFKKIYINNDRTASERALDRELRAERKKRNELLPDEVTEDGKKLKYKIENSKKWYWGIRNDKLVCNHTNDRRD